MQCRYALLIKNVCHFHGWPRISKLEHYLAKLTYLSCIKSCANWNVIKLVVPSPARRIVSQRELLCGVEVAYAPKYGQLPAEHF